MPNNRRTSFMFKDDDDYDYEDYDDEDNNEKEDDDDDNKQIIALEWNEPRFKLNYIIYSVELLRHKLNILTTIAVAITSILCNKRETANNELRATMWTDCCSWCFQLLRN